MPGSIRPTRRRGPPSRRGSRRRNIWSRSCPSRRFDHRGASKGPSPPSVPRRKRRRPMSEAVIVASSRTQLAKSFRGSFNLTRPDDFTAHTIKDVLGKVPQLDPKEVEDVIMGCGQPHGSQGHNIARVAAMRAGLPTSVAGTTVNRFCSSGLQSIAMAAHHIMNDGADAAIGGGVEAITMMKRDNDPSPWVKEHLPGIYMVMGDTAEVVAKRYKISRQVQDEYSLLSQQRTARGQQDGFFKEELAPMQVTRGILDRKTGEVIGKEEYYV